MNPESQSLHARVAAALNWPIEDAQAFSLQALRDLLRLVNPELAHEVGQAIAGALRGGYGLPTPVQHCKRCGQHLGANPGDTCDHCVWVGKHW